MLKIIIYVLIYVNVLLASSYNFTEVRYSDALGKSAQFEGEISFSKAGLNIKYLTMSAKVINSQHSP